jgi:hypothetical protein
MHGRSVLLGGGAMAVLTWTNSFVPHSLSGFGPALRLKLIGSQLSIAVLVQGLQSRRCIGQFGGVNHTVFVGIESRHQRRGWGRSRRVRRRGYRLGTRVRWCFDGISVTRSIQMGWMSSVSRSQRPVGSVPQRGLDLGHFNLAIAVFIQCFQDRRSIGQFGRVNDTIFIRVQSGREGGLVWRYTAGVDRCFSRLLGRGGESHGGQEEDHCVFHTQK